MEIDATKRINPIARIVIEKDGYILLTSATENNSRFTPEYHFLPGGHIEHTECARDAIVREMQEEFEGSEKVKNISFLGVLECVWDNDVEPYHEINIVFKGEIDDIDVNNPPKSKEEHIKYGWYKLYDLPSLNLLPKAFPILIPIWISEEVVNLNGRFFTEIVDY